MDTSIRDTIARVAREEGIDPAYALAVAERESSFNPNARASKSIAGLFQMTGNLRRQYGSGDSADPETQTRAFARFTKDLQGEMASHLGRDPTTAETYLGHFWGGPRAARVLAGDHAGLAPSDLFSARELAENPQLARGSSAGGLASTIMADIGRRQAKYGGNSENPTGNGMDFSAFGQPLDSGSTGGRVQVASNDANFAQFGAAKDEQNPDLQDNFQRNAPYTKKGASTFNTDLGGDESKFRDWVKSNKVPFNPDAKGAQDYDMRGFYKGLQSGDPNAKSAVDPNDHQLHYPDYWKTPYHQTFSNESQWADPAKAPKWNDQDQLVTPDGKVQFDDRAKPTPAAVSPENSGKNLPPVRPGTEIDVSQFDIPQRVAMGYDPIADEMGSGKPAEPTPKDQELIQPSPGGPGQPMERNPAFVPKAPLQQVPEENLDPNRPDFYQRQLDASAQPPDFSQFGASPPTTQA